MLGIKKLKLPQVTIDLKTKNSMENPVKIYYYDGIRLPRKLKKRLRKQGYIF